MKALNNIIEKARHNPRRIVLCEGQDERVLTAAVKAAADGIARPVLVGSADDIKVCAEKYKIDLSLVEVIDPATSPLTDSLSEVLLQLRKKKGMTPEQARSSILEPLCFSNLLVREGHADGVVSGAVYTTADVVRTAIQLLGLSPGVSWCLASS